MRKRDCAFLTYRLAMLLPSSERPLNTRAQLCALTAHALEPQDLSGYWTKVHHIFSISNSFIDSVNAIISLPGFRMVGATFKKESNIGKT